MDDQHKLGRFCGFSSPIILFRGGATAENRRADADMGGAEPDGEVEIGAHAHAETGQAMAAGNLAQQREVEAWLVVGRRDAHEDPGNPR